jgi:hypothetical protein
MVSPSKVTFDERIISLGHIFDERFPLGFNRVLHVGRDLYLFGLAVFIVTVGFQPDQVDDAVKIAFGANGKLKNNGLGGQTLHASSTVRVKSARSRSSLLMKMAHRAVCIPMQNQHLFGLYLDTINGIHKNEGGIGCLHAQLGIGDEILIAGRVDQADGMFFQGS